MKAPSSNFYFVFGFTFIFLYLIAWFIPFISMINLFMVVPPVPVLELWHVFFLVAGVMSYVIGYKMINLGVTIKQYEKLIKESKALKTDCAYFYVDKDFVRYSKSSVKTDI